MSDLIKEGVTYPNGSSSVTVLKYEKAIKILVKHNDEHGHEMWTQADRIRKGAVRNPFEKHKNGLSFTGYGYCCNLDKKLRDTIYGTWRGAVQRTITDNYGKIWQGMYIKMQHFAVSGIIFKTSVGLCVKTVITK